MVYWNLKLEGCNVEDLENWDLEYIASMIKQGYTSGEIINDEALGS